jgi:hypothetical protein
MGKNKHRNHSSVGAPKQSKRAGTGQRKKKNKPETVRNAVIPAGQQTESQGGGEDLWAEPKAAKIDLKGKYIVIAQDTDSNPAPGEVWPTNPSRSDNSIYEVPMEYRAQVAGRCQRQYIKDKVIGKTINAKSEELAQPAALHWIDEWRQNVSKSMPFTLAGLTLLPGDQPVKVAWRLVSNSGIDEGFIRPVIAAGGWPIIPGSSIKGLFRRACREIAPSKVIEWCGGQSLNGETQPGLLRFHGAWPADDRWKKQLLDVTHPQQFWQVGIQPYAHSANALVSLFEPRLNIAVSSRDPDLNEESWKQIRSVIHHALGKD